MFENETKTADLVSGTEKRLLEAAGEIFAEHGYRAATVRQICEKARANIAAVNYHFGDKEGLYMAVLRSVHRTTAEKYPPNLGVSPAATPEQKLRVYVRSLLLRIFDEGRPGWHTKIMMREMIEPTRALDMLVEEGARPLHQELSSIVRELLGPAADDEVVRLSALSVVSQCVYYRRARPVITRLYPEQRYDSKGVERLTEHITQFSLLALDGLCKKTPGEVPGSVKADE
jgi:TetR/AcrR family transcriptional regulator, regulator of cefoperazone and chloramphenicol sensitivity